MRRHKAKIGKSYSLTPGLVEDIKALAENLRQPESWIVQHGMELYVAMICGHDSSLLQRRKNTAVPDELPLENQNE